ncbi:MAG: hypothetical protein P1P69_02010 [Methanosarcinaceae archaeon]|nr:hypothetical protein [Methanosarcinaceae archaeon]MDF1533262.1 hypothetical protein [Methanosarcinaceae archaeon]
MKELPITQNDIPILRKLLPLVCLIVPWEIYQYGTGWGIKFSLFYLNFDMTYGTLAVNVLKQLTMLSYGGFAPSIRTIFWAVAAALCVGIFLYELAREHMEYEVGIKMLGAGLIVCGILLVVSSLIVWSDAFRAIPVGFGFFAVGGYLLMIIKPN